MHVTRWAFFGILAWTQLVYTVTSSQALWEQFLSQMVRRYMIVYGKNVREILLRGGAVTVG